eukprot:TRINITY_DN53_c0_g1_i10.p1 TRINITY_DN53_c0_g1~~TRINITY_DN53_c0_g1_i10.p1  ORF type:complete len:250 (-),score=63.92 TRINITY_DN53_c0_g1_i10:605-1354(-)
MALAHELNPKDNKGSLSDESKGMNYSELIRDYEPLPDTVWRFGKPNYAKVNQYYFQHRTMHHPEGSLEAVVSKLVKNWEVESHHIADIHQWQTMDITKFKAGLNGGCPASAQLMADIGPYNMLLGETQDYSGSKHTFLSSNTVFSATFPEGFAWECLEVYSGPPLVSFKWRHFGKFSGVFTDKTGKQHAGNDKELNLYGLCNAKVNAELKIESLDVYYNPDDMIKPLMTNISPGGAAGAGNAKGGCLMM